MKSILLLASALIVVSSSYAQNVGIGITAPLAPLHIKSTVSSNPLIIDGNGNTTYYSILESGVYRGYWGSFSGNPEDVDFGTGAATTGKLHLTIQASPKLTIDNTGNIGIGTTSPNYKMHITGGDLFLQSSAGKFIFGYDGSNQWRYSTTGGGADMLMSSYNGTTETFRHYFAQNGNVGIGTGSGVPATRLHVSSTASETIRMQGANPYLSLYDNTDGYQGYLWYNGTDMVLGSTAAALRLASAGYRMAINNDGRVYIGTGNAPATGYLLSVNGKVICTEAKVQLSGSWPDYVFAKDYRLMPLEELEKNILQNKHLPNIPSSQDVTAANGIELGDMNRRLLEKVEELTLYIIELNKENKTMSERISKLEKR